MFNYGRTLFLTWRITKDVPRSLTFQSLNLDANIVKNLRHHGIRNPTEIQIKAIEHIRSGKSAVINSETGSGKTLAYAIPLTQMIQELKRKNKVKLPRPFGLVLVPNVELGYQVYNVFTSMLLSNVCMASESSPLKLKNTDIAITTPHYLYTYPLDILKEVQAVVLDEADIQIARKVGKHGKKDPLFNILWHLLEKDNFKRLNYEVDIVDTETGSKYVSPCSDIGDGNHFINRQFIFVGATMPDNVNKKSKTALPYIRSWIPDIDVIQSEHVHKIASSANMSFLDVLEGNKTKLLVQFLHEYSDQNIKVVVFVNNVNTAIDLYGQLSNVSVTESETNQEYVNIFKEFSKQWGGKIFHLHKKIQLFERLDTISNFASMEQGLLITTDVMSRGIDIPGVDFVIQYDFATNVIDVLHRAGRTARMNRQGKVINFITEKDEYLANAFKTAIENNEPLDAYFSRHRGLRRRIKRGGMSDSEEEDILS